MINITIYRKPEHQFKGFQVVGHADSVSEGADLVCCAISVLTINVINSLKSFTDDEFDLVEQDEIGLIQVTFKKSLSDKAALLMESYTLGVDSVADGYGDWLKVKHKEV